MLSIKILTYNAEETLEKTLISTLSFPEVILYDTGSTDSTLSIARTFKNVQVVEGSFEGFGKTHNRASQYPSYDWILSLDSDEVLSPELIEELQHFQPQLGHVYTFQRHNFLHGKFIKWCGGWHPDWVVRLYNRKETNFTDAAVHERVLTTGLKVLPFSGPIYHTPYRKISDFLTKMQNYSSLFAEENKNKKHSSIWKALLHGWTAFLKSYICKRGILGGKEGFIISLYNGQTTFYKYLKLWEQNTFSQERSKELDKE